MGRLADSIILLWGWRRLFLAMLAGAVTAFALAPFDLVPVPLVTIPILVWLIDGSTPPVGTGFLRRLLPAFGVGWAFGFGYFLAGLWWIGVSFLVDGDTFAWLMPVAVVVFPALLGIIWGVGTALARLFWSDGWPRIVVFAIAMTGVEWLRGHILTGFPWNAFGYALMPEPVLMQSAAVVGVWGITLLAFLVFAAPVLLVRTGERFRVAALLCILLLLAADAAYGVLRLRNASDETVAGVRLRIVQPNIDQRTKEDPAFWAESFRQTINLSAAPAAQAVTHVIWPETAIPYILTESPQQLAAIAAMLDPGMVLLAGAPRADQPDENGDRAVMNSILVIEDGGVIIDSYDKVHLVPFGEYLPLQGFLEGIGLRQLISLPGGFEAGVQQRSIVAGTAPAFAPLICYEAIFPHEVVPDGDRPGWLLNVTNDAWYGDTPGPRQHLRQAIVRAVEEGLPLVRAANTGISAIVDPYGRIVASLELNETGVIDGDLPAALPRTTYARFGDTLTAAIAIVLAILAGLGRMTQTRRPD
ncbi:MAG: apolipoprotein N-acyltransferase [Bauldia sp.]|nr:apolipoprotein N-acyltransferase [Bauldia sp.]